MGVNRRQLLQSVGGSVGLISISEIAVAEQGRRQVKQADGAKKRDIIFGVQSTDDATKIIRTLSESGWVPDFSNSKYGTVITEDGDEYDQAVIPFKNPRANNDDEVPQTAMLWNSKPKDEGPVRARQRFNDGRERVFFVSDGTVETRDPDDPVKPEGDTSDGSAGTENDEPLDGGGGGNTLNCNVWKNTYCANWDLSCLMWISAALGVGCTFGNVLGCLLGAGISIGEFVTDDGCNPCDSYTSRYVTVCDPNSW